jgi:serine/threonine protein kinase
VLHQIGVGALGPVFRTYEPERDRLVAVKAFRIDITPEQARTLTDELSRAAEAGLFHPSIVEPIAAGVEGTLAYAAEEYVAAESLDVAMRHYAPAPIGTVLPFITQLAGAIDFARAAGVGHGSLHPRDIFVTPEEARATGFGVVEALERIGFRAPVRRPYSPPERIAGAAWTTTADVFSLAAITYELLTARRPAGLGHEIGPLTAGTPNAWMDTLHAVLARAMDPEPSARFATALAFAAALEAAARGAASDATLPMAPPVAAAAVTSARPETPPTIISPKSAIAPRHRATEKENDLPRESRRAAAAEAAALSRRSPEGAADLSRRSPEGAEAEDDISAEQFEDDADHQLRLSEREDLVDRDPTEPLDPDIEAEAEADRFAGDDFLLDAAGAASAAPRQPYDVRARDLPIDADPSDTLVDARALDDDEVMVEDSASPAFASQDLQSDETILRPGSRAASPYNPIPVPTPAVYRGEAAGSTPTPLRTVALVIAGIAVGLIGGYAVWGGGADAPADPTVATPTAAPSAAAPADRPAPAAGREFSEQAVAPPAPGGAGTAARPGATPPATVPGAEPRAGEGRAASAPRPASTGTLVIRSTPVGAGVTLNGRWRGRTPLTLDALPFRRYDVRVVQPGYAAAAETIVLSADAPARSLALQLVRQGAGTAARPVAPAESAAAPPGPTTRPTPPAATTRPAAPREAPRPTVFTGSIYVDSRPRGARVTIDGKPVGVTPLRVPDVRIGTHVVRLELADHRWWSTTTRVTAGQEQRVTGSLEQIK